MPSISTVNPTPGSTGQIIHVTGPDIGICTLVIVTYETFTAPPENARLVSTVNCAAVRVSQNELTFILPDVNPPEVGTKSVSLTAQYTINGSIYFTAKKDYSVRRPVEYGPPAVPSVPSYGYNIPEGPYAGPEVIQRWTFHDPYDSDPATATYVVPINPNKMGSPFPTRRLTTQATTAVDGQVLFFEGARQPATWSFGGVIFDPSHYDALRSWVYDRNHRIEITDHFGRKIVCYLTEFKADPPARVRGRKYWRHEYTISGTVVSVGKPTAVPT